LREDATFKILVATGVEIRVGVVDGAIEHAQGIPGIALCDLALYLSAQVPQRREFGGQREFVEEQLAGRLQPFEPDGSAEFSEAELQLVQNLDLEIGVGENDGGVRLGRGVGAVDLAEIRGEEKADAVGQGSINPGDRPAQKEGFVDLGRRGPMPEFGVGLHLQVEA